MARGAAAGKYTVKSCGEAHAWCERCRPEMAKKQRKPKRPAKQYSRSCRNCGRCDACLGLTAPEGQKVCRSCGLTKPIEQFAPRRDTGGRRNACFTCRNVSVNSFQCEGCGRQFTRHASNHTRCPQCRVYVPRNCARCGLLFSPPRRLGLISKFCSEQCRDAEAAELRIAARRRVRMEVLQAYGGASPACVCCGESQPVFLALDHVDGGGHKQRTEMGGGGFYSWLRRQGYPPGFRILCHNCNFGRQLNGGVCPHQS